jgi:hypothetical protein
MKVNATNDTCNTNVSEMRITYKIFVGKLLKENLEKVGMVVLK